MSDVKPTPITTRSGGLHSDRVLVSVLSAETPWDEEQVAKHFFVILVQSDGSIILTDGAIFRRDVQRGRPCGVDRVSAPIFSGPHAGNAADAFVTRVAKDRALRVHLTKRTMVWAYSKNKLAFLSFSPYLSRTARLAKAVCFAGSPASSRAA